MPGVPQDERDMLVERATEGCFTSPTTIAIIRWCCSGCRRRSGLMSSRCCGGTGARWPQGGAEANRQSLEKYGTTHRIRFPRGGSRFCGLPGETGCVSLSCRRDAANAQQDALERQTTRGHAMEIGYFTMPSHPPECGLKGRPRLGSAGDALARRARLPRGLGRRASHRAVGAAIPRRTFCSRKPSCRPRTSASDPVASCCRIITPPSSPTAWRCSITSPAAG